MAQLFVDGQMYETAGNAAESVSMADAIALALDANVVISCGNERVIRTVENAKAARAERRQAELIVVAKDIVEPQWWRAWQRGQR
jgi:hypothetical protein